MKNKLSVWTLGTLLALAFPIAALADISNTVTLSAGTSLNLDTGVATSPTGDLLWTGTEIAFQGNATGGTLVLLGLSGASGFASVTQTILQELAAFATSAPILASALPVGTILGVSTNGGNGSKVLVTALSGATITLQYTTYEAAAPTGPTITGVQNNYNYILPSLPNYGIAPGTLFIITGSGLASVPVSSITALNSSAPPGIPTMWNGASLTVTVGSFTGHPGMYYAGATQIAAVLPSATPVGTGTITVTYNNVASNAFTIQVVASALGLDTYYGTGSGLGVATDLSYNVFTYTNSAKPGQPIILWGSGLGADTADSDTTVTSTPHVVNVPITIYFGGIAVTPGYAGSSGYPGLVQINVTIPPGVATGCGVSVVAVTGTGSSAVVSNSMTLPIGAAGGVCADPLLGYTGTQLSGLTTNQTNGYTSGTVAVNQVMTPGSLSPGQTELHGVFYSYPPSAGSPGASSVTSIGSCSVTIGSLTDGGTFTAPIGLDAGTITDNGPGGALTLTNEVSPQQTGPSGLYFLGPANSYFGSGGTFTFTGSGGKTNGLTVGPFTVSITYTNPLVWTNMNTSGTVTRANGQSITWTGGGSNTYVYIFGSSATSTASASFTCYAPASAGQFTVPSYVLMALPAATGQNFGVTNYATPVSFTASGLTTGVANVGVSFQITATYN